MKNPDSMNKVENNGGRYLMSTSDLHMHLHTCVPTHMQTHIYTCMRTTQTSYAKKKEMVFYWLCGRSRDIWLHSDAWGNSETHPLPIIFLPHSLLESVTSQWLTACDFIMQIREHWVQLGNVVLLASGTPLSWGVTQALTEWRRGTLRSFQS